MKIEYSLFKGCELSFDPVTNDVFGRRKVNNKVFGCRKSVPQRKHFFCPHCKTDDISHIKERKIDVKPQYISLAYGHVVADTVYGKSYSKDGIQNYPVSVKFYCTNCENEHTKPELIKAQIESDKNREKDILKAHEHVYLELMKIQENPPQKVKIVLPQARMMSVNDVPDLSNPPLSIINKQA